MRPPVITFAAVALLVFSLSAAPAAATAPLVGGGGFARYFRAQGDIADVASVKMPLPSPELTIELWVRLDNTVSHAGHGLFTYGAVETPAGSSAVRDLGSALKLSVYPQEIYIIHHFGHPGHVFRCQAAVPGSPERSIPQCSFQAFEGWTHVALTVNSTEGNLKLYLNGTKVVDLLNDGKTVAPGQLVETLKYPPPPEGGIIIFGQDPSSYQASYRKDNRINGLLDEIRVWATERSQEEIQAWMHRTKIPPEDAGLLRADFCMDSTGEDEGVFDTDNSGNGNDLAIGAIDEGIQTIRYSSDTPQHPTVPPVVISMAGVWDGPIGAAVGRTGSAEVTLRAREPEGRPMSISITRMPQFGYITQLSGNELPAQFDDVSGGTTVRYTTSNSSDFNGDSFQYTATNNLGESSSAEVILIHDNGELLISGTSVSLRAEEGSVHFFQVGGFARSGEMVKASITERPHQGQLYQAELVSMIVQEGVSTLLPMAGDPITAVPQVITARSGVVAYVAPSELGSPPSLSDSLVVSFYTDANSTNPILPLNFTFSISPANDFPVPTGMQVAVAADELAVVELLAQDEEGDVVLIELQEIPADGATLQRSDGFPLTTGSLPIVSQHVTSVPDYSEEWGPAFSSQVSLCPCCYFQETCSSAGGPATAIECPCAHDSYTSAQVFGPPDVFPLAGMSPLTWSPMTRNPDEFIVVAVEMPIYVTAVKLYEVIGPGAVTGISAASVYKGNMTDWTVLYSGSREELPTNVVRIFTPELCSNPGSAVRYLRITLEMSPDQPYALDAVEVLGTLSPPASMLLPDNQLKYQPPPGVHGDMQQLSFTARDCMGSSGVQQAVNFTVLPPTKRLEEVSVIAESELEADIGRTTTFPIPLAVLDQSLPSHLQGQLPDSFTLLGADGLPDSVFAMSQDEPEAATDSSALHLPSPVFELRDQRNSEPLSVDPMYLQAWVHYKSSSGSVTYRLGLRVRWKCADGLDPKECALSSADCGPSGAFFAQFWDNSALRCRTNVRSDMIAAVAVPAVLILAGACLAVVLLVRSTRHAKVLARELHSLRVEFGVTSTHQPLLDGDTPLKKVTEFLKELSDQPQPSGILSRRKIPKDVQDRSLELRRILRESQGVFMPTFGVVEHETLKGDRVVLDDNANFMRQLLGQSPSIRKKSYSASDTESLRPTGDSVAARVREICQGDALQYLGGTFFFNTFGLENVPGAMPLTMVAVKAIDALELGPALGKSLKIDEYIQFVIEIESRYNKVDYHSALHAADVTARLAAILNLSGIRTCKKPDMDHAVLMLAALVSAVVHDVGHTGQNNAFHCTTVSREAKQSHDIAVLEFNSLTITFQLLEQAELDFMANMSQGKRKAWRKAVIELVMATDFSRHFEHIDTFSQIVGRTSQTSYHELDGLQQLVVLKTALKVADIGHCTADFPSHVRWVHLLEDEFFKQGDLEKENRLPAGPLMDRTRPGAASAVSLVSFMEGLALPLFRIWVEAFPGSCALLDQAEANLQTWVKEISE